MSQIVIGKSGRKNVAIDIDILIRTRLLVQANSGGGKSWLLRLIAEQLFGKVPIHILDPEGEFASLREKFPFVLIGEGGEAAADVRSAGLVAQRLLELRASAVIDLYEAFRSKPGDRRQWVRRYLEALVDAPKTLWKPLIVLVDEAHKFCPQEMPKAGDQKEREIIQGCKDAMISLATVGRKRRFCAMWATQRLAKVDKDATAELLNRLIGPTFEDVDIDRAADLLSVSKQERPEFKKTIRVLEPGNFFAIGRAVSKERVLFKTGDVVTTHPDVDSTDYSAVAPPTPEKVKKFLPKLSDLPQEAEQKLKSEADYKARIRELEVLAARAQAELKRVGSQPKVQPAAAKPAVIDSRMIAGAVKKAEDSIIRQAKMAIGARHAAFIRLAKDLPGEVDRLVRGFADFEPERTAQVSGGEIYERGKRATPVSSPAATKPVAIQHPRPSSLVPSENGDGELTPYQSDILRALVELEAVGRKHVPKGLAGAAAGKSHKSSTFERYTARLKELGLIAYRNGKFELTDAGREKAGAADTVLTSEELQQRLLRILTPYQQDLVRAAIAAYPDVLSIEDLAQHASKQSTSSTFERYLSSLRAMEIIESPEPKTAKAAAWLFLE
jgi:hypothetical protein